MVKSALPQVCDSLAFYSRLKETDAVGLNMSGLSLEMNGMLNSAVGAYSAALAHAPEKVGCWIGLQLY